jgi:hypothetical protein
MLKLLLFTSYSGTELKTAIYANSLSELEDRTRRYLTEHKYDLIGLSNKHGGSEMVYWRHYARPAGADNDGASYGFPESNLSYLDRNVAHTPAPAEYEANLDGDFHFTDEEWSLADAGGIAQHTFTSWDKALEFYIGHLKEHGRIVAASREEFEAYRLRAAEARGPWWYTTYLRYLKIQQANERSVV